MGCGDGIICTRVMALPDRGQWLRCGRGPSSICRGNAAIILTKGTTMSDATMTPDQVVSTLNSLIEMNRDGQ